MFSLFSRQTFACFVVVFAHQTRVMASGIIKICDRYLLKKLKSSKAVGQPGSNLHFCILHCISLPATDLTANQGRKAQVALLYTVSVFN